MVRAPAWQLFVIFVVVFLFVCCCFFVIFGVGKKCFIIIRAHLSAFFTYSPSC